MAISSALVTSHDQGIGFEIALSLSRLGLNRILGCRRPHEAA